LLADGLIPDAPADYDTMLRQLPLDQMTRVLGSPYFGTVVPVQETQKIEGETFVQNKVYLRGSDPDLDAAYTPRFLIGSDGESIPIPVIHQLPDIRSLAQMSRENGLDSSVPSFDEYVRIRNLQDYGTAGMNQGIGSDARAQNLWRDFLDDHQVSSSVIRAGYNRIDTAATVVDAAATAALAVPAIVEGGPVAFGYGYFASQGADYLAQKAGLGEDARLLIGFGAGMAAGWGLGHLGGGVPEVATGEPPGALNEALSSPGPTVGAARSSSPWFPGALVDDLPAGTALSQHVLFPNSAEYACTATVNAMILEGYGVSYDLPALEGRLFNETLTGQTTPTTGSWGDDAEDILGFHGVESARGYNQTLDDLASGTAGGNTPAATYLRDTAGNSHAILVDGLETLSNGQYVLSVREPYVGQAIKIQQGAFAKYWTREVIYTIPPAPPAP
jgi:hypothetical protein